MRSGTTLVARWLGEALPGPTTALRETGIALVGHQFLTVLEYNQRSHEFGFQIPGGSTLRTEAVRGVAGVLESLYRDRGHRPGNHLVDKQPYALGDTVEFYDHLYELFPDVRIIATVRTPEPTIASMRRRTWGRGPWPRPALISPVTPLLSLDENVMGDLNLDGSPAESGPADEERRWSLAKACLHYSRAVLGLAASVVPQRGLVLEYDRLGDPATREAVEDFLSTRLERPVPYEPSNARPEFTCEELSFIRQETRAAQRVYDGLARRPAASWCP